MSNTVVVTVVVTIVVTIAIVIVVVIVVVIVGVGRSVLKNHGPWWQRLWKDKECWRLRLRLLLL